MNPSLYWRPKKKKPAPPAPKKESSAEVDRTHMLFEAGAKAPTQPAKPQAPGQTQQATHTGGIVGFWIIPDGAAYSKLAIYQSYDVALPGNVYGYKAPQALDIQFGDRMMPIWPIVVNRQMLAGYFSWLTRAMSYAGLDTLLNPNTERHDESVESFLQAVLGQGWSFWLQQGDTGSWCGGAHAAKYFPVFLQELSQKKVQNPSSVVTDYGSVVNVSVLDHSGRELHTLPLADFEKEMESQAQKTGAKGPGAAGRPASNALQAYLKANAGGKISLDAAYPLVSGPQSFKGTNAQEMAALFSPGNVNKLVPSLGLDEFEQLQLATKSWIQYAQANNIKLTYDPQQYRLVQAPAQPAQPAAAAAPASNAAAPTGEKPDSAASRVGRGFSRVGKWMTNVGGKPKPRSTTESLEEATFRQLIDLTQANGGYVAGGLRFVAGRWVIDPSVHNRIQNARFVITRIPNWQRDKDGLMIMNWTCQSRPDRNTTGMRQTGFVKLLGNEKWWKRLGKRLMGRSGAWDMDSHVFCSCPDFKYRFHWVLSRMNATHTPTGAGGEATNQAPRQTNPHNRPSLCKHLVAIGALMQGTPPSFRDTAKKMLAPSPIKVTAREEAPEVDTDQAILDEIDEE